MDRSRVNTISEEIGEQVQLYLEEEELALAASQRERIALRVARIVTAELEDSL